MLMETTAEATPAATGAEDDDDDHLARIPPGTGTDAAPDGAALPGPDVAVAHRALVAQRLGRGSRRDRPAASAAAGRRAATSTSYPARAAGRS
jgi:hypothetical protein